MKIYAIPGLGTNRIVYDGIKIKNHELIILKWPPLKDEYSLGDYAKCFLNQIKTDKPFCLLGLSFGGMLAIEIGKIIHPEKIILISSVKVSKNLPLFVKALRYFPIHRLFSEKQLRSMAMSYCRVLGFSKGYKYILLEMIKEMPPDYFRTTINYIVNWKNDMIPQNCILIHGSSDKLIKLPKKNTDYIIPGGTHVMIVTRAAEINKILEKILG